MATIAAAIAAIEAPAEPRLLQHAADGGGVTGGQALGGEQRFAAEQALQRRGGEAFTPELQQLEQPLADARFALLAAVGEAPGQGDAGGAAVAKHCTHQGAKASTWGVITRM